MASYAEHDHDWHIWPETDGQSQRCAICKVFRDTPEADKFWIRKSEPKRPTCNSCGLPFDDHEHGCENAPALSVEERLFRLENRLEQLAEATAPGFLAPWRTK